MADEDKEKAEKVAAAKKRYEQLKKQKAKKAGGAKKKDEKAEGSSAAEKTEEKVEEKTDDLTAPEPVDTTRASPGPVEDDEPSELPTTTPAAPSHGRKPSVAVESRQRSASFYRASGTPTSPTAITPGLGVSGDIYREQAQRIEELERENKRLAGEVEEGEKRWKSNEEELEELREGRGDVALAAEKGKEAEKLKSEVESLKRQVAQLQSQTLKSTRKTSTASPSQSASIDDLNAQVASKTATIESLESEISNLNKQLGDQTSKTNELQAKISALESSLQKAEQEASSTKTELSDLKTNLEKAGEQAAKEGSDRDTAHSRIAQLEAELGAANRKASDSVSRAELLEKKVETLTQLHRDNDARNQTRLQEHKKTEREAAELRTRVTGLSNENARLREAEQRRRKADLGSIEDTSVQELVDEERDRLLSKVRELEEENFELRRGVWRDRRAAMQPGIDDSGADAAFDDIDLSGTTPTSRRQTSSLQDVIASGISAFTGKPHPHAPHRRSDAAHQAKPGADVHAQHQRERQGSLASLGTLDSFEFDEEAFRKAQEEEGRKRIERVREVKRGLAGFKGWRVDFVDVRVGMGGVFDI
ncbi:hypothetical protein K458DRAFT_334650 [Lentithecium fluviatile CBS 122367]|uniref:M protein repeat protein n=1 Tax=Lentithecium fluviatile CBS 122367 TaxID=1168545 RepID=A0A6G1J999_9PLEO|nr:hypothetical protein K458DRAFT_334650 [Lentithecium fluviatile CBS 122367]